MSADKRTLNARRPVQDYWRHDLRVDPPTPKDRRRLLFWVAFLGITPICLGVVVWAALDLNGNYPTVASPVPHGWQSVPGVYASFSAPRSWALNQSMSDSAGDVYYSGPGGAAGESVVQSGSMPSTTRLPTIVSTYLVKQFEVAHPSPYKLHGATEAWEYTFHLAGGDEGAGVLAWVKSTQSEIWLIVTPVDSTTREVLSTLTVAS